MAGTKVSVALMITWRNNRGFFQYSLFLWMCVSK